MSRHIREMSGTTLKRTTRGQYPLLVPAGCGRAATDGCPYPEVRDAARTVYTGTGSRPAMNPCTRFQASPDSVANFAAFLSKKL